MQDEEAQGDHPKCWDWGLKAEANYISHVIKSASATSRSCHQHVATSIIIQGSGAESSSFPSCGRKRKSKPSSSITSNELAVARTVVDDDGTNNTTSDSCVKRQRIGPPSCPSVDTSLTASNEHYAMTPIPTNTFRTYDGLKRFLHLKIVEIIEGISERQYYAVTGVPEEAFQKLDNDQDVRAIRLYYDFDSEELIVKLMPLSRHEMPHLVLMDDIREKIREMGLGRRELAPTGQTTYRGGNTAKQGDSAVKPAQTRNKADAWPTLVIEAGVSESLSKLRIDAGWWLTNSRGDVRIVIIIAIHRQAEKFIIEKWQLMSPDLPRTRSQSNCEFRTPQSTTSITISKTASSNSLVASDNLVIEFSELLLRPPVPPESDIVLTKNDLEDWANFILSALR